MEHCGDDFLAALADAMQGTEDWEDLEAIESEACGTLNKIIETEEVVVADNRTEVSQGCLTEEATKRLSSSIDDEDSDLEVLSQKDGHFFSSNSKRGQSATQSGGDQPLTSTVRDPYSFYVRSDHFHPRFNSYLSDTLYISEIYVFLYPISEGNTHNISLKIGKLLWYLKETNWTL